MPKTLLLADDSVTIQKVVGISFANEDVVLLTVDNGDDAIARAKEARPDVVLADVVMPGKNGYEVCQAIKSDPALSHIPVLLLTGTFEAFDEQRASRAGADGHITKPFEAQALVEKVNQLLARSAAAARGAAVPAPAAAPEPAADAARPKPATRPAPPPPPAVSHEADTAYDFFDDEEVTAPRGASAPAHEDATLLFTQDRLEEAPSFGSDELSLEPASDAALDADDSLFDAFEEPPAAARDAQVETRLMAEGLEAALDPTEVVADPLDALAAERAPAALGELALEEALEGNAALGEAVLDPAGARDYDVSSSDLGAPLAAHRGEPLDAHPIDPGEDDRTAFGFEDEEEPPALEAPPAPWHRPEPAAPAPAAPSESASPTGAPAAARAAGGLVAPEAVRDALEKLAWEALGPVTEQLVKEAVERIERVAWEVIPQLAETLIREEIRKLKGE